MPQPHVGQPKRVQASLLHLFWGPRGSRDEDKDEDEDGDGDEGTHGCSVALPLGTGTPRTLHLLALIFTFRNTTALLLLPPGVLHKPQACTGKRKAKRKHLQK